MTPPTVGGYFEKINCFCFSQQTLQPGEKRDLAVVFAEQSAVNNITLSYTFFPVRVPDRPVAEGVKPDQSGHI